MPFEVFDKAKHYDGPHRKEPYPVVGVQRAGHISLNSAALKALGEPEALLLFFDPDERVIGLGPSTRTNPAAFPLRMTGRTATTRIVSARSFLRHFGAEHPEARRYPARMYDGMLTVPLREERPAEQLRAV